MTETNHQPTPPPLTDAEAQTVAEVKALAARLGVARCARELRSHYDTVHRITHDLRCKESTLLVLAQRLRDYRVLRAHEGTAA